MKRRDEASFVITPLQLKHQRGEFDCGVASLNEFLQRFARQNETKNLSRTFVVVPASEPSRIAGYYTLSPGALKTEIVPEEKLPRYPVPVAHLGRLAVDINWQKLGIGEHLLLDALRRCLQVADEMGIYAVEVVALDEAAGKFYAKYGFVALKDNPLHLYLALKTVAALDLIADK